MEQLRLVCLDNERHALLNFDKRMRLRKQLPLRNLIQVRDDRSRRCHMVVLSAVCVCRRLNKATPMTATCRLCLLTHDVSSSVR